MAVAAAAADVLKTSADRTRCSGRSRGCDSSAVPGSIASTGDKGVVESAKARFLMFELIFTIQLDCGFPYFMYHRYWDFS